jgi:hypothetical protein
MKQLWKYLNTVLYIKIRLMGDNMNKNIALVSIISAIILVLAGLAPVVGSKDVEIPKKIVVEMNSYAHGSVEKVLTELSYDEALELKECLINLNDAIEQEDEQAILECETILNEKGILGEKPQKTSYDLESQEFYPWVKNSPIFSGLKNSLTQTTAGDISNALCYFHAAGEGMMIFTIGVLLMVPIMLIIAQAPELLGLVMIICVAIMLATHVIPFRVGLPIGILTMSGGSVLAIGLSGAQHMDISANSSAQITVGGFSGITINIPGMEEGSEGFLFVSGFSLIAQGKAE